MTRDLEPEDAKLVTLARTARVRNGAAQGAAVRDLQGRTYVATTVRLDSLSLEALDLAVAMAASSGATGLEAGAVVGPEDRIISVDAMRDLAGTGVSVLSAAEDGTVRAAKRT